MLMVLMVYAGRSVLYTLMDCLEDGSVVTWGEVPKMLMVLMVYAGRSVLYTLMDCLEDGSVVTWGEVPKMLMVLMVYAGRSVLYTLMGCLEDGSVVTWGEVLKRLMVFTGNAGCCVPCILMGCVEQSCSCCWFGWNSLSLRCCAFGWVVWRTSPPSCEGWFWHLSHESSLPLSFPVEIVPATLRWFFQVQAPSGRCLRTFSWTLSASYPGPSLRRFFATAVAIIKLDTMTPAYLNFKSVRPAGCVATRCARVSLALAFTCSRLSAPGPTLLSVPLACTLLIFFL